jgi:2-oxoglutarate dehydrogenase complex dehydrogenase (E1) component-like enzyme
MYEQYLQDPNSVHPSWKTYFDNLEHGIPYDESQFNKPTAAKPSIQRATAAVSKLEKLVIDIILDTVNHVDISMADFA